MTLEFFCSNNTDNTSKGLLQKIPFSTFWLPLTPCPCSREAKNCAMRPVSSSAFSRHVTLHYLKGFYWPTAVLIHTTGSPVLPCTFKGFLIDLRQGFPRDLAELLIISHLIVAFQHPVVLGLSGLRSHLIKHPLSGKMSSVHE